MDLSGALTQRGLIDLTKTSAFLLRLLNDAWLWRQRLVETLEFRGGDHVRVTSAYQIEFPADLLQEFVGRRKPDRVRVLVPLTTRDKQPVLAFSVRGPSGASAPMLLRSSIASLQAEYLGRLVSSSPAARGILAHLPHELLSNLL